MLNRCQSDTSRLDDSGKNINILKLDVEGEEFYSIPQMLHSKILSYVDQIHLEVSKIIQVISISS